MSHTNGLATKESLLQATKRRYVTVPLPDGKQVRLQSLTERERSEWEASALDKNGRPRRDSLLLMKARLIVRCAVDADGSLLFSINDAHDLQNMDSQVTNLIFDAAQKHLGITDDDLENLEKNFEPAAVAASPSG